MYRSHAVSLFRLYASIYCLAALSDQERGLGQEVDPELEFAQAASDSSALEACLSKAIE
jgi:hypothetical protein